MLAAFALVAHLNEFVRVHEILTTGQSASMFWQRHIPASGRRSCGRRVS